MAAIVLPRDNSLQQAIMGILAQAEQRRAQQEQLNQQQQQFDQTMAMQKPLVEAQTKGAHAAIEDARTGREFEKNSKDAELFLKNFYDPLIKSGRLQEAESGRAAYSKLNPVVGAWEARPMTSLDEAAASAAQWMADTTARVAGGGQSAADVNLATKFAVGEQLSPQAFGSQEQREHGSDALAESAAIKSGRKAGAAERLASQTAITTTGMQTAAQERIAREGNASAERVAGTKTGAKGTAAAEGTANLAADAVGVIDRLLAHPGFTGAVGSKGASSLFGIKETPIAGTDAAGARALLDQLRAIITLPNLSMLKGLGAMSDREFKTMQAAGAALNEDVSEDDFKREAARVRSVMGAVAQRLGGGAAGGFRFTATNPQTGQRIGSNDGVNWEPIR